jgi:hypothetical protein
MRILRLAPVALLGLAAVIAQPAALADTTTHERQVVPYSFTWTPANCPLLAVPISGSGNYTNEVNTQTAADGSMHVIIDSLADGIATDTLGNTYRYNYHQHIGRDLPPGGYPREVLVNDHFNLQGSGPDGGLHAGFVYRVTFPAADQPPVIAVVNSRGGGDPCDPI